MLRNGLFAITKRSVGTKLFPTTFNKIQSRFFSVNLDGLRNILKSEINHEESNYSPVDQSELQQFFQNTKFEFFDKENSMTMELRKTIGNFDIVINFQAKPPMPQEEGLQEEERSNLFK